MKIKVGDRVFVKATGYLGTIDRVVGDTVYMRAPTPHSGKGAYYSYNMNEVEKFRGDLSQW